MRNTIIIIIIGILLLLAVTNPGLDEFNSWIKLQISQRIEEEAQDGGFLALVQALGLEGYVANYIMPDVTYRNYIFFSVYKLTFPGEEEAEPTRIIGVANQFIKL